MTVSRSGSCRYVTREKYDEDGIYDPAHFNDRLLLGLKGTMSEAELHVLYARLRGGIVNKARRGELRCRRPVGFVRDGAERVVLDPDQQVQESVRLLFDTFARTGAAHTTVKYFRAQGLLYPTRLAAGPRKGEVAWAPLSLGRVASTLHNPWYAGAYAFGRCRSRKLPDGHVRHERLPSSAWLALIRDAHPAYISWEEYERIQCPPGRVGEGDRHAAAPGPPREGPGLLQGRAVCGLCGQRMHIHYNTRRGGQLIPNYVCVGRGRLFGDPMLDEYTDAQVANVLNERGLLTGAGGAFDPASVHSVRFAHQLKSLKQRLLANGWLTSKQITATLGVGRTTLGRWRAEGRTTRLAQIALVARCIATMSTPPLASCK